MNSLLNFFKDKSKSTLQYDISYIKTEGSEVDIQVESISVNLKQLSSTGKSVTIWSNNIRKSVWIKKAVLGSYHQGNLKYGETAGIQSTSNAFIAVCFDAVKNVSIWKLINIYLRTALPFIIWFSIIVVLVVCLFPARISYGQISVVFMFSWQLVWLALISH